MWKERSVPRDGYETEEIFIPYSVAASLTPSLSVPPKQDFPIPGNSAKVKSENIVSAHISGYIYRTRQDYFGRYPFSTAK